MNRSFIFGFLASALLLAACSSKPAVQASAPETVSGVEVRTAKRVPLPDLLEAVGTVHPAQTAQVGSQATGTLVSVWVHAGDHVKRGQLLAVVDSAQARASVERARAAVAGSKSESQALDSEFRLAQATTQRYEQLFKDKSVTAQEYDEVRARSAAAQARRETASASEAQARAALQQAQTSLEQTNVRAPFDGVVTARLVDPGTVVAPGVPIVTVEQSGRLRLEVTVNESEASLARLGINVPILLDGDRRPRLGKVAEISPAADPASRSVVVKLELASDPALRSGIFGRAFFERGTRDAVVVPESAIIRHGQLYTVFALNSSNIAETRFITVALPSAGTAEILSGLGENDRYIAAPGGRDWAGKRIEVR